MKEYRISSIVTNIHVASTHSVTKASSICIDLEVTSYSML